MIFWLIIGIILSASFFCSVLVVAACICGGWDDERMGYDD